MSSAKALPQLPPHRPVGPASKLALGPELPPRSSSSPRAVARTRERSATAGGDTMVVKPLARTSSRGQAVALLRRAASDRTGQRPANETHQQQQPSPPVPPKDVAAFGSTPTSRKQRVQAAVDRFEAIARETDPPVPPSSRSRSDSNGRTLASPRLPALVLAPGHGPSVLLDGESTPRGPQRSPSARKAPPVYEPARSGGSLTSSPYVSAVSSPELSDLSVDVIPPAELNSPSPVPSSCDEDTVQPWQRALSSSASDSTHGESPASATGGGALERADSALARMESLARLTGARPGPAPNSRSLPAFLLPKHAEEAQKRGYRGPVPSPDPPLSTPAFEGPLGGPAPTSTAEVHGLGFGVGLGGRGVPRLSALQRKALEKMALNNRGPDADPTLTLNRSHTTTGSEARREAGRLALGKLGSRRRAAPTPPTPVCPSDDELADSEAGPEPSIEPAKADVGPSPAEARQQARSNLMRKLSERGAAANARPVEAGPTLPLFHASPRPARRQMMGHSPVLEVDEQASSPSLSPSSTMPSSPAPLTFSLTSPSGRSGFDRLARLSSGGELNGWDASTVPNSPDVDRMATRQHAMERLMTQKVLEPPSRARALEAERSSRGSSIFDDNDSRSSEPSPFAVDFDDSPTAPDFSSPLLRTGSAASGDPPPPHRAGPSLQPSPMEGGLLAPPHLPAFPSANASPTFNSPAPTAASTRASGVSAYTTTSQYRAYRHSIERDRDSILDRSGQDGGTWDLETYASLDLRDQDTLKGLLLRLPHHQAPVAVTSDTDATSNLLSDSLSDSMIDASHFPDVPASSTAYVLSTPRVDVDPSDAGPSPVTFPRSPQSIRSATTSPSAPIRARRDPGSEMSVITFGGDEIPPDRVPSANTTPPARQLPKAKADDEDDEGPEVDEEGRIPIILDEKLPVPATAAAVVAKGKASPGRAKVLAHHPRGPSFGRSTTAPTVATSTSVASFPASISSNSLDSLSTVCVGATDEPRPRSSRPSSTTVKSPTSTWRPQEEPISENEEHASGRPSEKPRPPALEHVGSYKDRVHQAMEEMSRGHSSSNGSISSTSPLFLQRSGSSSVGHSTSTKNTSTYSKHQKSASSSTSHSIPTPMLSSAAENFAPRADDSTALASPVEASRCSDPKLSPFPGLKSSTSMTVAGSSPARSKTVHHRRPGHGRSGSDVSSLRSSPKGTSPVHTFFAAAASRFRSRSRSDASATSVITPFPRQILPSDLHRQDSTTTGCDDDEEHLSTPGTSSLQSPYRPRGTSATTAKSAFIKHKLAPLVADHVANPAESTLSHPPRKLLFSSSVLQVVEGDTVKGRFVLFFNDLLVIAKPRLERNPSRGVRLDGGLFAVKSVVPLHQVQMVVPNDGGGSEPSAPALDHFATYFNISPEDAILTLMTEGYLKADAGSISDLLFKTDGLDKLLLAQYLCEEENAAILRGFVQRLDLAGLRIDDGLRLFVLSVVMPDDVSLARHLVEAFAQQWAEVNSMPAQTGSLLALCIMEFNDALHSKLGPHVSGVFAASSPDTPASDFVYSFRSHDDDDDGHETVSVQDLLDIAHDVRRNPIVSASKQQGAQSVNCTPTLPTRLLLGSTSDEMTVTLPRAERRLNIRLHGRGLTFSPPVLTFDHSKSCTFRVTADTLGPTSVHLIPTGPLSWRYSGLPRSHPVVVEKVFMRHAGHLRFLDAGEVEKRYLFSFPTGQMLLDAVGLVRKRHAEAAGQTPAEATVTALEVLRRALVGSLEAAEGSEPQQMASVGQRQGKDGERWVSGSELVATCQQNSLLPFVLKLLETDRPDAIVSL